MKTHSYAAELMEVLGDQAYQVDITEELINRYVRALNNAWHDGYNGALADQRDRERRELRSPAVIEATNAEDFLTKLKELNLLPPHPFRAQ